MLVDFPNGFVLIAYAYACQMRRMRDFYKRAPPNYAIVIDLTNAAAVAYAQFFTVCQKKKK